MCIINSINSEGPHYHLHYTAGMKTRTWQIPHQRGLIIPYAIWSYIGSLPKGMKTSTWQIRLNLLPITTGRVVLGASTIGRPRPHTIRPLWNCYTVPGEDKCAQSGNQIQRHDWLSLGSRACLILDWWAAAASPFYQKRKGCPGTAHDKKEAQ